MSIRISVIAPPPENTDGSGAARKGDPANGCANTLHQTDEYVAGLLTEEENTELLRLLNKLYLGLK